MKQIALFLLFTITIKSYSQINEDLYVFTKNDKKGYVDNKLKVVIEPRYQELGGFNERFFGDYSIFKKDDAFGILDLKGNEKIPSTYEYLGNTSSPDLFHFTKDDLYGLINSSGKQIIAPLYDSELTVINGGKSYIAYSNNVYFLLDKNGIRINEKSYQMLSGDDQNNRTIFKEGFKYGYLDKKGNEIIKASFDYAWPFIEKFAMVKINEKWALINKKGEVIENTIYDQISYQYSFYHNPQIEVTEKIYYVKENNKTGLLDKNLTEIVPPIYDEINDFSEGLAYVKLNNKYGYINLKGEIVIPIEYEDADSFSESLAPVVKDKKWGFINSKNEVKIDFTFPGAMKPFFNGFAEYRRRLYNTSKGHYVNDSCGYIDKNGKTIIPIIYTNTRKFINGVARVNDPYFKYLIDKKNNQFVLLESQVEVQMTEQMGN